MKKPLTQRLCLLGVVSLLSYTAALCLLLLTGCGAAGAKDRAPVQPLTCTRPAALSGITPTGGDGLCLLSFDTERMGYAALSNDLRQWTLYSCDPADVCFVDGYACVDAREDRARIMEYFMVHEDAAQLLIESPVIRRKLRLMCGAVRDNFDTTGWGQVRWESLL